MHEATTRKTLYCLFWVTTVGLCLIFGWFMALAPLLLVRQTSRLGLDRVSPAVFGTAIVLALAPMAFHGLAPVVLHGPPPGTFLGLASGTLPGSADAAGWTGPTGSTDWTGSTDAAGSADAADASGWAGAAGSAFLVLALTALLGMAPGVPLAGMALFLVWAATFPAVLGHVDRQCWRRRLGLAADVPVEPEPLVESRLLRLRLWLAAAVCVMALTCRAAVL